MRLLLQEQWLAVCEKEKKGWKERRKGGRWEGGERRGERGGEGRERVLQKLHLNKLNSCLWGDGGGGGRGGDLYLS